MILEQAITQLRWQGQAIIALTLNVADSEVRWKPNSNNWSMLEVLNHLVDEEILDFRRHLDHILHTPEGQWPEINPQAWVTEKNYNDTQMNKTLENFKKERDKSITWLMELSDPDWDNVVNFSWGSLCAGDMLASWLAHDLLHLRQLIELRYQITLNACQPFSVEYAGKW